MEIPEIDQLLKSDEANVRTIRQVFAHFSADLPRLLNEAANLYTTCCRAFGQGLSEYSRTMVGNEADLQAKVVQGLLLARIGVLYGMAVADFLRMRVTSPLANVRLQCESLGFIKLMGQDSAIARKWQAIQTEDEGRRFFNDHQKRLKTVLKSYDLAPTYDKCSEVALHSRFIGLARGFKISQRETDYRIIQNYMILAQEFDPDHPHYFVAQVLFAIRAQAHILANVRDAAPLITDRLLNEMRIPRFLEEVTQLDKDLRRRILPLMKTPPP